MPYFIAWIILMLVSWKLGMLAIPFLIYHAMKEDQSPSSSMSKPERQKPVRRTKTKSSHKGSSLSSTVRKSSSMARRMR